MDIPTLHRASRSLVLEYSDQNELQYYVYIPIPGPLSQKVILHSSRENYGDARSYGLTMAYLLLDSIRRKSTAIPAITN